MAIPIAFFRHGSNALIAFAIVVACVAWGSGALALPLWAVATGAVLFFLSEYGTHRFVLHAPPAGSAFVRRLQHRLHYDHHTEPTRLDLLFLPPWFLLPTLALFAVAYAYVARDLATVVALLLGNLLGLLWYEWAHYVAHIPLRPRTPHHFRNERLWFGVTNPAIDRLAGTYVAVDAADRSGTTRTLFR